MEKITIIENGRDRVAEFDPTRTAITIGRAPENDVQITEKRASRQHVRIESVVRIESAEANGANGNYKIVDLGSANGTRLNGTKFTETPIRPGDKIEIGETVLFFGQAVAAEPAATVVAPAPTPDATVPLEPATVATKAEKSESPKKKTTGAKRRTTSRKHKSEDRSGSKKTDKPRRGGLIGGLVADIREGIEREVPRQYRPYLSAGVGVVVALPILFLLVAGVRRLTATDERPIVQAIFDQGVQSMEKGDAEFDSARRLAALAATAGDADAEVERHYASLEGHYQAAEKKFDEVIARNIDPDLTRESKTRRHRMQATLERNRQASEELRRLRDRVEVAGLTPTDYLKELASLEKNFGDTLVAGEIARQRNLARDHQGTEIAKLLGAVEIQVAGHVTAGRWFEAMQTWRDFAVQYQNPSLDRKIEEYLGRIDAQAVEAFADLSKVAQQAADAGRIDEARRLYEMAMTRFRGTSVAFRAGEEIALLDLMRREGVDRQRGIEMMAKQSKFRDKAREADELARANKYEAAMAAFQELIDEIARTGDKELKELTSRYESRIGEMRRIVALIEKLKTQLADKSLRNWSYTDASGIVRKIDSADDSTVNYSFHDGKATVPKEWSEHTALEMYFLFKCMDLSAEDRFALAIFCFDNELLPQGHAELVQLLREEPKRRDEVFGYFSAKSGKSIPEGGFVVHDNHLMTPLERDRHEDTKKIDKLVSNVGKGDAKERQQTLDQLEQALSDAGVKYGEAFVAETKSELVEKLNERKQHLLTQLQNETSRGDIGSLRALRGELETRRAHALELIFDEQKYPYDACHGCEAQPEVDKRAESVREVWDRPSETARTISPDVGKATDQVNEINGFLSKMDPTGKGGDTGGMDLEYIKSMANKRLDIKNFGETSQDMKKIADSNTTMDENESKQTVATALEKDQVRITNEYRVMMGKNALRLDDRLVQAARGHSEFMQSSGQFDHNIPGHPNGVGPQERCNREGYDGAVGENIYMGSGSPQAAHDAWVHSSGHHRNILRDGWKAMGAGNAGNYWTQNFGSK